MDNNRKLNDQTEKNTYFKANKDLGSIGYNENELPENKPAICVTLMRVRSKQLCTFCSVDIDLYSLTLNSNLMLTEAKEKDFSVIFLS